MTKLSIFKKLLGESTVPEHLKSKVESWDIPSALTEETHVKMAKALTKGTHTHFPLTEETPDADSDVVDHLTKHGWEVKDYKKGIATKKTLVGAPERGIPMREKFVDKSIGAVLKETNAHENIHKAFANDPARSNSRSFSQKSGGLHVVVAHSPMAIAGMSTGTAWKDQSCMNMEGGSNSHYLPKDVAHGTHVAFLVNHDDHEAFSDGTPNKPVARIALKAFHHIDNDGKVDTIFRPESRTYGTASDHFSHAVSKWATDNYPAKAGVTYHKERGVYDDTGDMEYFSHSKESIKKSLDNGDLIRGAADHGVISHAIAHIEDHVHSDNPYAQRQGYGMIAGLGHVNNLGASHVAKLTKVLSTPSSNDDIRGSQRYAEESLMNLHGDKVPADFLHAHIAEKGGADRIPYKALMNPKLTPEHIDQVRPSKYHYVRNSLIQPHHMDKLIADFRDGRGDVTPHSLQFNQHRFDSDHLHKVIDASIHRNYVSPLFLVKDAPAFEKQHHDRIISFLADKHHRDTGGNNASEIEGGSQEYLSTAKHVTFDDVKKFGSNDSMAVASGARHLAHNPNISVSDAKQVKDHLIYKRPRVFSSFYNGVHKIISDQFTDKDYRHLAKAKFRVGFEDKQAGAKWLHAGQEHLKSMDEDSGSSFNDRVWAIKNHIDNIREHVNMHVAPDVAGNEIRDKVHHTLAINYLHAVKDLKSMQDPDIQEHIKPHFDALDRAI